MDRQRTDAVHDAARADEVFEPALRSALVEQQILLRRQHDLHHGTGLRVLQDIGLVAADGDAGLALGVRVQRRVDAVGNDPENLLGQTPDLSDLVRMPLAHRRDRVDLPHAVQHVSGVPVKREVVELPEAYLGIPALAEARRVALDDEHVHGGVGGVMLEALAHGRLVRLMPGRTPVDAVLLAFAVGVRETGHAVAALGELYREIVGGGLGSAEALRGDGVAVEGHAESVNDDIYGTLVPPATCR
jgi:hypothetical protein